ATITPTGPAVGGGHCRGFGLGQCPPPMVGSVGVIVASNWTSPVPVPVSFTMHGGTLPSSLHIGSEWNGVPGPVFLQIAKCATPPLLPPSLRKVPLTSSVPLPPTGYTVVRSPWVVTPQRLLG